MNMTKLRKKHNRYRCLKTISYLLGFPLFILMVLVGSMCLFEGDAYTDIKWYGIIACVLVWLVSVVLQILISLITKSYNARTMFMLIVSVLLVVGGSVVCDITVSKKYEEIAAEYAQYGVELNTYKYEAGWVNTWTTGKDGVATKFGDDVSDFCKVYNIGYKSKNYGKYNSNKVDDIAAFKAAGGEKADMTDADYVLSRITYDKKEDAYYSVNGLYADGYIFGFKQALNVLIDYNQAKFDIENNAKEVTDKDGNVTVEYVANGKNADTELMKALKALDADSEWIAYKNSAEYKAVYGKGGSAYSFMLDVNKLDKILGALGSGVMESSIIAQLKGLGIDITSLLASVGLSENDVKNLSVAKVLEIVNGILAGMGENEAVTETLAGFGIDASKPITEDDLMDVLANFSFYQYPTMKPKFSFLKDETLRKYAQAQYYATVHGANVGSVLIGDRIGHVTMSTSGYPADTFAYSLKELYTLKARSELAQYYPFMLARKYGYICAGIIALMTVLFYVNKRKEDEAFALIANGGRG